MAAQGDNLRITIAQEAARLMLEGGMRDFQLCETQPLNDWVQIPAVVFQPILKLSKHWSNISACSRRFTTEAVANAPRKRSAGDGVSNGLRPRLVGSVLSGTADEHSYVELHLFTDAPEEVGMHLMQHNIPYELADKRLRLNHEEQRYFPTYRFLAGDAPIELLVMPSEQDANPLEPDHWQSDATRIDRQVARLLEREAQAVDC